MIKFVEEKDGLNFAEAVELLADRYGVELEREQEDPRAEAKRQRRRRLEELLDRAASFYSSYLWESEEAGKARDYLAQRGLREEVLRAFGVGYAPSAWDKLLVARPAGRVQRRGAARRRPGPARPQRRRVRPLPRADHVPDPRPPRPRPRLRRPGDALRPGRQVRQHGRDRVLPQEPDPLRGRPGQSGDRQGRPRRRRRGLHRRPRPAPGRDRGGGGGDGDGDHRRAGGGALGDGRRGRARPRRRRRRAGGDAAGAERRRRAPDAAAGGGDAGRRGPGGDDGRGGGAGALPRACWRRPRS